MGALSEGEIREALATLPGWKLGDGEILKHYKFPTFAEAIAFIVRVADAAEAAGHHPDIENHYNRVRVALHTWSERAITEKDLALAGQIEAAATT